VSELNNDVGPGYRVYFGKPTLYPQEQQELSSYQLDCDCRFDPPEAPAALLANFWLVILALPFSIEVTQNLPSRQAVFAA
jgi:hypothetical protein